MRRAIRITGAMLATAGVAVLVWAVVVWQWQDPVTAVVNELDQRELAQQLERAPVPAAAAGRGRAALAASWREQLDRGDAVGRLRIPSLGVNEVVVNGTDAGSLERGPGRHLETAMPGEGELVYVAGHRTTYGAPFSRIDRLRKGDRVVLELPYATFEYRVTGHRIVEADETWVLRSRGFEQLALQACHPRFFASQRYIAYATPVRVTSAS